MRITTLFLSLSFFLSSGVSFGEDYTADYYQPYTMDATDSYPAIDYGSTYQAPEQSVDTATSSQRWNVYPSQIFFEYMGGMGVKNGAGEASVKNLLLYLNLFDIGSKWKLTSDALFRMTWYDGDQDADLGEEELYTIRLSLTGSYKLGHSSRLGLGISPEFSTDADSWTSDNFMCGAHAFYASRFSDKLQGSIGIAYAPQLSDWPVIPFITFDWQVAPKWSLKMNGLRLSMMNKVSEHFSWGPFIGISSGSWIVKHNYRHARFEWRSCVIGVGTEVGLGKWWGKQANLIADLGFTCSNKAEFKTTDGDHSLGRVEFDPGLYVRAGLQFSF